jgi:hypothetical protein
MIPDGVVVIFAQRNQPFSIGTAQFGFSFEVSQVERHKGYVEPRTDGGDADEDDNFYNKYKYVHKSL